MINLLSYNIAWGKKLDEAGEWIMSRPTKPDILCLQEIPHKGISSFKKTLEENGYSYKYAPAFTKGGITYGQLTAYRNDKIKLVFSQVIDLGSSRIARLISRHNSKWSGLLTVLRFERKNFIIINVHLLPHALNGKRRKQLEMAIGALNILNFMNLPTLIAGDYNYSSLMGRGGLIRFMSEHGFKIARKKKVITHSKWRIKHQTDYVFARSCKITSMRAERIKFSDHFPVFVKFTL